MFFIFYFISYQLLQLVALPMIIIYFLVRKWRGKPVFGVFSQRMGFVPAVPRDKKVVWIHAVSVGEVLAVQQLIVRIKMRDAKSFVYVTTGTLMGNKIAREQLNADIVSFIPYDFLLPVLWAFKRINPAKIIVVEAELWPNLLMLAAFKKVPLYLINARITKSYAFRSRVGGFFIAPLLRLFKHLYAQTAVEKEAFVALGIAEKNVTNMGNIKAFNVFVKKEMVVAQEQKKFYVQDGYPTLLVGSLHQQELALYLDLFKALKPVWPHLKIIIAPRHFHWQLDLVQAVKALGVPYFLWDDAKTQVSYDLLKTYDIILVCTIGKLFELYPLADLFFLGGTFIPVGGHNLLEPAAWSKPTIVGPYYHNSEVIADELEQIGALVKVMHKHKLVETVSTLLQNPISLTLRGSNAGMWLEGSAKEVDRNVSRFLSVF